MKILRFYNEDLSVDVQYKTDLINDNATNFTVLEVSGLDEAEIEKGIDFKLLEYNLYQFIEFAQDNELALSTQDVGTPVDKEPIILVELPEVE